MCFPFISFPVKGSSAAYPFSFLRTSFQNFQSITAHSQTRNKMPFHAVNPFHLKCKLILALTEIKVRALTLLDSPLIRICSKTMRLVGEAVFNVMYGPSPGRPSADITISKAISSPVKWPYRYCLLCKKKNDLPSRISLLILIVVWRDLHTWSGK